MQPLTPRGAKPAGSSSAGTPASSGRAQRTLALRINIDAKVAPLGERKADRACNFRVFPGEYSSDLRA
ncbi:hypothetical protein V1294_007148 [Bradyrhizobium sp. AZCC 1678]